MEFPDRLELVGEVVVVVGLLAQLSSPGLPVCCHVPPINEMVPPPELRRIETSRWV